MAKISRSLMNVRTISGIALNCFIARVAVAEELDRSFERELQEQRAPSIEVARAYDLRMIL